MTELMCINFQAKWAIEKEIGVRNGTRKQYLRNLKQILPLDAVVLTQLS